MNCPLCTDQMLQPRLQGGIEVDVCPHCHGLWLDRGEIEKLVGRDDSPVRPVRAADPSSHGEVWTEPKKKRKKKRQKSLGERLGDILEDALDL